MNQPMGQGARVCSSGHPNAPQATYCTTCGAPLTDVGGYPAQPQAAPQHLSGPPPGGYPGAQMPGSPTPGGFAPPPAAPYGASGSMGNDSGATTAMILSIIGVFLCVPLAIGGMVMGYSARKRINASGGMLGGSGQATTAIVLGWVAVALWVLLMIFYAVALGSSA